MNHKCGDLISIHDVLNGLSGLYDRYSELLAQSAIDFFQGKPKVKGGRGRRRLYWYVRCSGKLRRAQIKIIINECRKVKKHKRYMQRNG